MDTILDSVAFLLSLVFLGYSAYRDLKTREVPDRVWMIYLPIAVALICSRIVFSPSLLVVSLISVIMTVLFSFLLFYLGLFGGADAKALICLSVASPTYPFSDRMLASVDPLFSLAVLYNGYFLSLCMVVYVVVKNLRWKYVERKTLFHRYQSISVTGQAVAFLTGYKTYFKNLREKSYLYPMEAISQTKSGILRKLKMLASVNADRNGLLRSLGEYLEDSDEVWATPGIPLLIFVLAGFISTALVGDILLWLGMQIALIMIG